MSRKHKKRHKNRHMCILGGWPNELYGEDWDEYYNDGYDCGNWPKKNETVQKKSEIKKAEVKVVEVKKKEEKIIPDFKIAITKPIENKK